MHARTIYRVIGIYICVYYNDLLAKHVHMYIHQLRLIKIMCIKMQILVMNTNMIQLTTLHM